MKVLSSSRILYMCLLILVTSMAWCVVKPDVVNAYDVSGFYGAGNCKCRQNYSCTEYDPKCRDRDYYGCLTGYSSSNFCEENSATPCGYVNYCESKPGVNYNCEIMDG